MSQWQNKKTQSFSFYISKGYFAFLATLTEKIILGIKKPTSLSPCNCLLRHFLKSNDWFHVFVKFFFFFSKIPIHYYSNCMKWRHTKFLLRYNPEFQIRHFPVSILYKSIAGRYQPVRVADGPITARYRFIKNASWVSFSTEKYWYFSYFSTETYVVVLCRSASPRRF